MTQNQKTRVRKRGGSRTGARLRPFDFFVALSLLAVFFVLVLHSVGDNRYTADTPAIVTVTVKELNAEQCKRLAAAEVLYFDGIALAREAEATFGNSRRTSFNRYGEPVVLYSPERYDCSLTLRIMGADTEEGYFLDGRHFLARGASLTLATEGLQLTGTVTDLKKTPAE